MVCPAVDYSTETTDSRYIKLDYSVTEISVQEKSGVLNILNKQPLYDKYVPRSATRKNEVDYHFFVRSTILWKNDCSNNLSRQDAID